MNFNKSASKGKYFVLTQKGYDKTPDSVKPERTVGKPLKGYEDRVPYSWYSNGWVEEKACVCDSH